jgi:hypothetical protein
MHTRSSGLFAAAVALVTACGAYAKYLTITMARFLDGS